MPVGHGRMPSPPAQTQVVYEEPYGKTRWPTTIEVRVSDMHNTQDKPAGVVTPQKMGAKAVSWAAPSSCP